MPTNSGPSDRDLVLRWSARWSLTSRILAVNIFAVGLLAGSFFWLDSYRVRLLDERLRQTEVEADLIAEALDRVTAGERGRLAVDLGRRSGNRIRIYDSRGELALDSWALGEPTYDMRDPATERWQRYVARWMDAGIEAVVGAEPLPPFAEPARDRLSAWPSAQAVANGSAGEARLTLAADRTPMVSAAVPMASVPGGALLITGNARDIRADVRDERLRLGIIISAVGIVSILLSLFLARTIVRPLRRLALAAQRVRLGRSREVVVPRLPDRRDEIGLLARALSDMTHALRQRIDATEALAADVAHELKNPLASLNSAIDSLARIDDPDLQKQLLAIVQGDVRRLDRLVTDITDVSRMDAELSRADFERVDIGKLIDDIVAHRDARDIDKGVQIAFARPRLGSTMVMGDPDRLSRVIDNLIDNAVSFSPPGGIVRIGATADGEHVFIHVEDEGPGVAAEAREKIFQRFYSLRPESEGFGEHSGLGLAIAETIVEGHNGTIAVEDRGDSASGARFVITLPMAR